ncbi:MAG: superoxide dismutase family protein [Candidatus Omnitrophica bacterium]|nr:superoxide dismutase family protein [Candidatus Omnitrophota bacterium]
MKPGSMWAAGMAAMAMGIGAAAAWAENGLAVIGSTKEPGVLGTVTLQDTPDGVAVTVQLAGAPPGQHAVHIHQYGDCARGGEAAGGHFNPEKTPHGFVPKDGVTSAHPGDMGNIDVGKDGSGSLTVTLPGVILGSGPFSVGGRSIVVHERADDFSQPTGNAGGRIGCGVIVLTEPMTSE